MSGQFQFSHPLPPQDVHDVVERVGPHWKELNGRCLLLTGPSGFFGSWLLETLCSAITLHNLDLRVLLLLRNPGRFRERFPHLAGHCSLTLWQADALDFKAPPILPDMAIHSLVPDHGTPLTEMEYFFRRSTQAWLENFPPDILTRVLLCSTGAVYDPSIPNPSENSPVVSVSSLESYGAIRASMEKTFSQAYSKSWQLRIARGFAFCGPRLPLDEGFALGNFLRNVLKKEPLTIQGDGSPIRSYLYAADMAVWLWTIFLKPEASPVFNVGSDKGITILDAANQLADLTASKVNVLGKASSGAAGHTYVPDVSLAKNGLGLQETVSFEQSLGKTLEWLRS